jgi:hypothetical protein
MERHRIMVIGSNVIIVQRISSYCLKKSLEVFPYYGIPKDEEITLFDPHLLLLCLPISQSFQKQILKPYILWSEQLVDTRVLVTTPIELDVLLEKIYKALNQSFTHSHCCCLNTIINT